MGIICYDDAPIFILANMHPFINKASQAAREGGRIITRSMDRVDRIKVARKENDELASSIDYSVESAIAEVLHEAYPDHDIKGEEGGTLAKGDGEYTWLIDPLNGTANFVYSIPHFAISIACMRAGHIEHGLIFDPARQEEFSATNNQGALFNQNRIRVTNRSKLSQAIYAACLSKQGGDLAIMQLIINRLVRFSGGVRCSGSVALDLAYAAIGRFDAVCGTGLKLWDMAAGVLLIKEAGGLVVDFSGDLNYLETGELLGGAPRQIKPALEIIKHCRSS